MKYGQFLQEQQRWEEAEVQYRKILEKHENSLPLLITLHDLARHHLEDEDRIDHYGDKILALSPGNATVLLERADRLRRKGNDADWLQSLELLARIPPGGPEESSVVELTTYSLIMLRRPSEAYARLRAALERHDDDLGFLERLLGSLIQSKKYEEVLWITREHEGRCGGTWWFWNDVSVSERLGGDRRRALEAARLACERGPGQALAWANLGLAQEANDLHPEALESYRRLHEVAPELSWARETYAAKLRSVGQEAQANRVLGASVDVSPR